MVPPSRDQPTRRRQQEGARGRGTTQGGGWQWRRGTASEGGLPPRWRCSRRRRSAKPSAAARPARRAAVPSLPAQPAARQAPSGEPSQPPSARGSGVQLASAYAAAAGGSADFAGVSQLLRKAQGIFRGKGKASEEVETSPAAKHVSGARGAVEVD